MYQTSLGKFSHISQESNTEYASRVPGIRTLKTSKRKIAFIPYMTVSYIYIYIPSLTCFPIRQFTTSSEYHNHNTKKSNKLRGKIYRNKFEF